MKTFEDLKLSPPIALAIKDLGYVTPSPIQAQALPILLGKATDFIGLAATGTGKTATFGIPMLEQIDPAKKAVQALIMCPTRELALQVQGQIQLLGKHKGIRAVPVYGGAGYGDQIKGLRGGAQIVVGTPGRLIDHLERGTLELDDLKVLVLDEADEMISMGFKEDLERLLQEAPRDRSNIWLFSATMSKEVRRVADTYLRHPQTVQVNQSEMLSTTVEQIYYPSRESDKPEILCKIIEAADDFYGLVFCQTKALVVELTGYLSSRGYKVDCLHGDKSQADRERAMLAFRNRRVSMLVCTDVASRGLDVKDVTHVINYSIPREMDVYVHRIGRTARSGKAGIAISLVTPSHRSLIARIEKMTKSRMKEGVIPSRRDLGMKKVGKMLARFLDTKAHGRAVELLDPAWLLAIAEMPSTEIVGRFLSLMAPEVFEYQTHAKPLQRPVPTDAQGNALPNGGRKPGEHHGARNGGGGRRDRPDRERRHDHSRRADGHGPRREHSDERRTGEGEGPRMGRPTLPRFGGEEGRGPGAGHHHHRKDSHPRKVASTATSHPWKKQKASERLKSH